MTRPARLKLRAEDTEDLAIISACLQDAVVAVREMTYLPDEGRFVLIANRFRWEDVERERDSEGRPIYERVHCGVCFETVTAARRNGIDQKNRNQVVSLLTIEPHDGYVDLVFSAGAVLRLEIERLLCHMQDLDEPWPTQWRPAHPLDET